MDKDVTDTILKEITVKIERILKHHERFDQILEDMKRDIHGLDLKIINGDNKVKEECAEKIDQIQGGFRGALIASTLGSLSVVAALIGSILGFLAWKHG